MLTNIFQYFSDGLKPPNSKSHSCNQLHDVGFVEIQRDKSIQRGPVRMKPTLCIGSGPFFGTGV